MKATLLFLLALLLGFSASAANITIMVGDNYYPPQTVTIRPGDAVTWQYQSGSGGTHPTASDNGAWSLFVISPGSTSKSLTFSTVGTYPYHCTAHGAAGAGMYGVITAAALPTTAPQETAAFQAYPNPATATVTLKLDRTLVREAATVQLLNPLGSVARTLAVSPASGP
ncbi:MAG TPA: plastocyanin/azurin family copper-binding protein [Hymenobacter sp.]|uniref:cupredoxin domain-containing protein n=1 Tax=Hymenobacter sp. TaxID=1898978 RepID=UPI002D7F0A4F|nr:plastocyanin/azurin family copper-binding protein [Hymenobacter sp.]HET9504343.1 plastocyanin/azurin family copper-binding protein [Hymenobacter sp.]